MEILENNNSLCSVGEALKLVGGKWRLWIINEIGLEKRRFGEMKRLIPSISEKMLIQELKMLTEAGILRRKAYKEIPPRVEYSLTDFGKEVLPVIDQFKRFGEVLLERNSTKSNIH